MTHAFCLHPQQPVGPTTTTTTTTTTKSDSKQPKKKPFTMTCLEPLKSQMSSMLARLSSVLPNPSSSSSPSLVPPPNPRSTSASSTDTGRSWPMSILSRYPSANTHDATSYRPLANTMPVDSFSIESLVADNPQELAASRRGRSKTLRIASGRHSCAPVIIDSTSRRSMNLVGSCSLGSSMVPPTPKRADTEPSPAVMATYHCDLGAGHTATTTHGFLSPPVQWGQIVYEPRSTRSPTLACSSPHNASNVSAVLPLDEDRERTRSRTPSPARKFAWDTLVPWRSGLGPRQMSEYDTLDELPPLDPVSDFALPSAGPQVLQATHRPSLISSP